MLLADWVFWNKFLCYNWYPLSGHLINILTLPTLPQLNICNWSIIIQSCNWKSATFASMRNQNCWTDGIDCCFQLQKQLKNHYVSLFVYLDYLFTIFKSVWMQGKLPNQHWWLKRPSPTNPSKEIVQKAFLRNLSKEPIQRSCP